MFRSFKYDTLKNHVLRALLRWQRLVTWLIVYKQCTWVWTACWLGCRQLWNQAFQAAQFCAAEVGLMGFCRCSAWGFISYNSRKRRTVICGWSGGMERSGGGGYPPRLLRKFPFNEGYISQFVLYRGIWPPPHIHTFYVVTPAPKEAPTYRKCWNTPEPPSRRFNARV